MDFIGSMELLEKYGLRFAPARLAKGKEEAVEAAVHIGFPVVLKIVSPEIMHKTERGCVLVNLQDAEHVRSGFDIVMANAGGARIEGVLVQKMVGEGVELIVGGKRDPQFGPLILFGLGGIFVEILRDISIRVCPIEREDAEEMIHEVKGFPILAGARGMKPVDFGALADLLVRTSRLVSDNPDVKELDFNPVIAHAEGYEIVDVRIVE